MDVELNDYAMDFLRKKGGRVAVDFVPPIA